MRNITSLMAINLEKHIQTEAERSAPSAYVMVQRNQIPVTESKFIERRKIADLPSLTDSDIAISHTRLHRSDEVAWVAYVSDGQLGVKYSDIEESVKAFRWMNFDVGVDDEVTACAIAFNSSVKEDNHGIQELCTEEYPWVFWIADGSLKARNLNEANSNEVITLVESDAEDVSVIRGPGDANRTWDFGLCCFYLANNKIYYKQLIGGVWCDAEYVTTFLDDSINISQISAFTTWNYRVGLQILTDTGDLYELFSYTEGIGVRGSEHMTTEIDVTSKIKAIRRYDASTTEHMEASVTVNSNLRYGLSPAVVSIENINDGSGNYGRFVKITMDYDCQGGTEDDFKMTSPDGTIYYPIGLEVDGTEITLEFRNFNAAPGALTVIYTKNTMKSPSDVLVDSFTQTFTPIGLVAPAIGVPEVTSIINNSAGTELTVEFTEDITAGIEDSLESFRLEFSEYTMVPGGTVAPTTRTFARIEPDESDAKILTFTLNNPNMSNVIGNATLIYKNTGKMEGEAGPVKAFEFEFIPSALTWKGHQNDSEHMEASVTVDSDLILITKTNAASSEHMEASIEVESILINTRDL